MPNPERDFLERCILCSALVDTGVVPALMAQGLIKRGTFADKRHDVLWRSLVEMARQNRPIDLPNVSGFLREYGADQHMGGIEYLGELISEHSEPSPLAPRAMAWTLTLARIVMAEGDALGTGQRRQVDSAKAMLSRTQDSVLRYPLPTLDALRGGWAMGEVDVLAAASNSGKTTLLSTLARRWVAAGKKVFYAGFELPAASLRLQWAAYSAGFVPGDIISGEYLLWPNADDVRARVANALVEQDARVDLLRCADADFVDVKVLRRLGAEAAEWGCDVFIIDHIDHVSGQGDLHGQSRQVVSTVLELGKSTGVRYLVATQLNQQGLAQDFLRSHRPVREEYVKQGGHKKEVATFMFGLARALRRDITKEELKDVKERRAEVQTIEEPYASQINVIKHRWYGERVGRVRLLSWERGEYTDYMSQEDRKARRPMLRADIAPPVDEGLRLMVG